MAAEVKCRWCGEKSPKEEMIVHIHVASTGTEQKLNIHETCYPKYLEDKEFKRIEALELDELYNTIRRIYKFDEIPNNFFSMYIQPLRNGNYRKGTKVIRKKEGVPFSLMNATYLHVEKSINWVRANKEFESSLSELKYGFAMMIDKIAHVKKTLKNKELEKKIIKDKSENVNEEDIEFMHREIKFKNKSNGRLDMSDYLD